MKCLTTCEMRRCGRYSECGYRGTCAQRWLPKSSHPCIDSFVRSVDTAAPVLLQLAWKTGLGKPLRSSDRPTDDGFGPNWLIKRAKSGPSDAASPLSFKVASGHSIRAIVEKLHCKQRDMAPSWRYQALRPSRTTPIATARPAVAISAPIHSAGAGISPVTGTPTISAAAGTRAGNSAALLAPRCSTALP
jgi:hypothetical protein